MSCPMHLHCIAHCHQYKRPTMCCCYFCDCCWLLSIFLFFFLFILLLPRIFCAAYGYGATLKFFLDTENESNDIAER